ncbi:MAG: TlpA family protein disulfide reductase, partial [Actinomycetota bacterium]|nr:TlpA family protein disulfide reductase [Actinomycetota bacterium]
GLPAVALPCLGEGDAVNLAGLRGRPVVLNAWAQWCGPCRAEMPVFEEFHQRSGDRVVVLGLNYQDEPTSAVRFAAKVGVSYPSVYDADGTSGVLRTSALPQTVFVDATGRVAHVEYGEIETYAELVRLSAEHLKTRP